MTSKPSHPFSVHVKRCRFQRDEYVWIISERGGKKRGSPQRYSTPEEARLAMKVTLDKLIADWQTAQ